MIRVKWLGIVFLIARDGLQDEEEDVKTEKKKGKEKRFMSCIYAATSGIIKLCMCLTAGWH